MILDQDSGDQGSKTANWSWCAHRLPGRRRPEVSPRQTGEVHKKRGVPGHEASTSVHVDGDLKWTRNGVDRCRPASGCQASSQAFLKTSLPVPPMGVVQSVLERTCSPPVLLLRPVLLPQDPSLHAGVLLSRLQNRLVLRNGVATGTEPKNWIFRPGNSCCLLATRVIMYVFRHCQYGSRSIAESQASSSTSNSCVRETISGSIPFSER